MKIAILVSSFHPLVIVLWYFT